MKTNRSQSNAELLEWYDALIFALAVLVIVFVFFVRAVAVDGISMEPTLQGGDRLLVQSIGYTPQRGDVVVIDGYINYGKPLVKRVIGLPGDRVTVINGELFINNKHYREKYVVKKNKANYDKLNWTIKVPKNEIFVLGDNRDISKDSRIVGCFKQSAINAVKAF